MHDLPFTEVSNLGSGWGSQITFEFYVFLESFSVESLSIFFMILTFWRIQANVPLSEFVTLFTDGIFKTITLSLLFFCKLEVMSRAGLANKNIAWATYVI